MFRELLRNIKDKFFSKSPESGISILFPGFITKFLKHFKSIKRNPYFIQIGFDFGTAYSKCIYRDIFTNKARVYIPDININKKLPFLISSLIVFKNGNFSLFNDIENQYTDDGLYNLKGVLVQIATGNWNSSTINSYIKAAGSFDKEYLTRFVENCAVCFLGCVLGDIRAKIRNQFPNFGHHPQDYMAVNMAIPVGEAERIEISNLFHKILTDAWLVADYLAGKASVELNQIENLREEQKINKTSEIEEACYLYPEVSANVQGFVRSRVSGEGIYLFNDTGAGTVDQSVFNFHRKDTETLAYLCGRVLQLGSGLIEHFAAEESGNTDMVNLEYFRKKKEQEENISELIKARRKIESELVKETEKTLAQAKMKLRVKDDINRVRVIFGGGGHCENPYKRAVLSPFNGHLFREPLSPDIISVPLPADLELKDYQRRWMRRLSVAYGLSFEKSELARFIYPKDVPIPSPEEIWRPVRQLEEAPGKEQC